MGSANPSHMLRMLKSVSKRDIDIGQVRDDALAMVKNSQRLRANHA
jgi:hypothetical protein